MRDIAGRTTSVLRIVVVLLFAGMCYQLGYNAGFANGNWGSRQGQIWDAAANASADAAPSDAVAANAGAVDLDDAASAPHGIMLAPPVVLNAPSQFASRHLAHSHHASHGLAAHVAEPKS